MPEVLFGAEGNGYDHIVKKVLTLFVPTKQIPKDMLMGLKLQEKRHNLDKCGNMVLPDLIFPS